MSQLGARKPEPGRTLLAMPLELPVSDHLRAEKPVTTTAPEARPKVSGGGAASRRKGLAGERECADVFIDAGWTLRGLQSSGDWLAFKPRGGKWPALHVEVKRQERLRLPEWLQQAEAEAPPGVPPVVVFRQSRGRWYAVVALDDLLGMIG